LKRATLADVSEVASAPESPAVAPSVQALLDRYREKGKNPEIQAFERRVQAAGGKSRASNVWRFIEDAVTGEGGFSSGEYLFPLSGEVDANGVLTQKHLNRRAEADYDRFAEHVCNAPWDLIVSCADMIQRASDNTALREFWSNVDRRGTGMTDFLEYPFAQARKYGTGWIFMDRPERRPQNLAEDRSPEMRPYLYAVPTADVVDWQFDDDGNLTGVSVLEPSPEHVEGNVCPIRIWTLEGWALFVPIDGAKDKKVEYAVKESGPNELGRIPAVMIFNDAPAMGKALGKSEMLDVSRAAQTVYNVDSEAREIERKCALFLAIGDKDPSKYAGGRIAIGLEAAVIYDAQATTAPQWISPDLAILQRLDERRKAKKDSAYEMAHLRALNGGVVQTSSGFHAEVEFQKTERRIARHAGSLEAAEKQIANLFLLFLGQDGEDVSITYPRDFGVRDMARLIDEVEKVTSMNLGETSDRAELERLFQARHPRKSDDEIKVMVSEAIAARSQVKQKASALDRIKAMAAEARGAAPLEPKP
jgi:hypothetical protein